MKKLKILFACVENSFRSQIAEGVAKKFFSDRIEAYSAGSKPSETIHPKAVEILNEIGYNAHSSKTKGFADIMDIEFDYLITMGCGETCPFVPSKEQINWNLPDIKNEPIEEIRDLRNDIKGRIENLLIKENI